MFIVSEELIFTLPLVIRCKGVDPHELISLDDAVTIGTRSDIVPTARVLVAP